LLLVGRSAGPRKARAEDWAPPMDGDGAVVFPPLCRAFKRSVDLAGAGLALFLTLPVLLLAAVAVVRDSEGPWLFRQVRLGTAGRPFTLFKLRTMTSGNDPAEHEAFVASLITGTVPATDGAILKLTGDRRITPVGHILRRLSIDELPQLLNVLQGRMSLVGPRPPLPGEVALYDIRARQRLAVKPGMTGLWQVSGRSRLTFEAMVELDIRYWSEWTPLLELRILARTPKVALFSKETA
jgi:lipopolysaccharide/colanic/teichoic acid biosynthesis glycosyltransferase